MKNLSLRYSLKREYALLLLRRLNHAAEMLSALAKLLCRAGRGLWHCFVVPVKHYRYESAERAPVEIDLRIEHIKYQLPRGPF